ncbi:jacalin-related lectin 9-like [Hordeum vulgare]|uniref:Dirigent protein n=1 Tax=Hordeum vulgare subsp. vulgare TaxID=112509 RepID=A0A8I6WPR7_HORVV|nr:jacalin-related lectin 9-like [Hordeum vulgare]KAE8768591.1 jacalin-related lectin 9-like [Hordeum vulgare]
MADPSYYQRFPVTQQLQHTEHIFHLYVEQRSNQLPNGNQIPIAPTKPPSEPAGHFGFGVSCDWDVRDGPTPAAKTVARAQGLLLGTGQLTPFHYFLCQNIIFTDERFKGSSLKLLGSLPNDVNDEWAIIGGTGEFAFAQGSVKYKQVMVDPTGIVIRELNICVLCTNKPMKRIPYKDGPLGGKGGTICDITEAPQRLESVTIQSGDAIDSIMFSYTDQAGKKQMAGPWGGNDGLEQTILLAPTENVTKVFGTTGEFQGDTVVTSLTFVTNVATYGPFGKTKGTPFSIPKEDGDNVVGFFGRVGSLVNALGVYVTPSFAN